MTRRQLLFLLATAALFGPWRVAHADDDEGERHRRGRRRRRGKRRRRHDDDYSYARGAVERGEAAPLADILQAVAKRYPGEVVEIEFEREGGRWVYEVKLIDTKGRLLELYVDAKTKEILKVEGE